MQNSLMQLKWSRAELECELSHTRACALWHGVVRIARSDLHSVITHKFALTIPGGAA